MMWPFYLMALVAIISTIRVITNSNPVHALLSLIISLLAVAGIFFMVGAPFAGALEIIVYAGAIMVLFVFVVMMLNLGSHTVAQEKSWLTSQTWAYPAAMSFVIGLLLVWMISSTGFGSAENQLVAGNAVMPKAVGTSLFTTYLLMIEVSAMLLLGALVAGYHLAKRGLGDDDKEQG